MFALQMIIFNAINKSKCIISAIYTTLNYIYSLLTLGNTCACVRVLCIPFWNNCSDKKIYSKILHNKFKFSFWKLLCIQSIKMLIFEDQFNDLLKVKKIGYKRNVDKNHKQGLNSAKVLTLMLSKVTIYLRPVTM